MFLGRNSFTRGKSRDGISIIMGAKKIEDQHQKGNFCKMAGEVNYITTKTEKHLRRTRKNTKKKNFSSAGKQSKTQLVAARTPPIPWESQKGGEIERNPLHLADATVGEKKG